jgi:hypothetical protein
MLVTELLRETGSHLHADATGLDFAASQADLATILHAEWFINANRDQKVLKEPIKLARPWLAKPPNADVTPARRAELERQLERRSAFRH